MQFHFSLETLLEHKRRLEDIARKEYLDAQALADQATKELKALYLQVDDARLRTEKLTCEGGQIAAEGASIDAFITGQKIRIEKKHDQVRELNSEAEHKHELLLEASKERKTLERLKEKRYETHRLQMKKRELKENDELVVTRFKGTGTL